MRGGSALVVTVVVSVGVSEIGSKETEERAEHEADANEHPGDGTAGVGGREVGCVCG